MILLDNDILSTFAKVKRLDLLRTLFREEAFYITSGVLEEIQASLADGYSYPQYVLEEIATGKIKILYLNERELGEMRELPETFGLGEKESVAVCNYRKASLLSNEKRVNAFCQAQGIISFRLPEILRALWEEGVFTKDKVRSLMKEIEEKDRLKFKSYDEILEDF